MTKRHWGVLSVAVVLLIALIKWLRARRVQGLLDQLAEVPAECDLVFAEDSTEDSGQPYRLGTDESATIHTLGGEIKLRAAVGYFGGTAIFVYLPKGYTLPEGFAAAFLAATRKEFVLQPAPRSSMGGDNDADFMISAGTDWEAHCRGERGYFKVSSAPHFEDTNDKAGTVSTMASLLSLTPLVRIVDNATA